MRRVLITGATGLIGTVLARHLVGSGAWEVVGSSRDPQGLGRALGIETVSCDLVQRREIREMIESVRPDAIVHLGAMSRVDECEREPDRSATVNVEATRTITALSARRDVHLVFLSSDFVFDGGIGGEGGSPRGAARSAAVESRDSVTAGSNSGLPPRSPYGEDEDARPLSVYGRHKLAAERIVGTLAPDSAVVRTSLVLESGAGNSFATCEPMNAGSSNIVPRTVRSLTRGEPTRAFVDQWRTPTWVEDLSRGLVAILERRVPGLFHVAGAEHLSILELALRIARTYELDPASIVSVESRASLEIPIRPRAAGLSIARARAVFGYEPTPLDKVLKALRDERDRSERNGVIAR
jgi:dTDP-4-dehydrorhamnose reductase